MRPLRVLYCTDTYPPQVNGVSVVTAISVDGLLERGWQVGVVCPAYPARWHDAFSNRDEHEAATQRITLPSAPLPIYPDIRLSLPIASRFSEAIRALRPDLVHAETEFIIGRLGARAARRAGIPVVTSYHTDFGKYVEAYGLPSLRGAVTRSLGRFHASARRTYTPVHVVHGITDGNFGYRITPAERAAHAGVTKGLRVGAEAVPLFLEEALRPPERFLEDEVARRIALPAAERCERRRREELLVLVAACSSERQVRACEAVGARRRRGPSERCAADVDVIVGSQTSFAC